MKKDKTTKSADFSVYVDLENARNAITAAAVELIRGNEHDAKLILINWLAQDRGEREIIVHTEAAQ